LREGLGVRSTYGLAARKVAALPPSPVPWDGAPVRRATVVVDPTFGVVLRRLRESRGLSTRRLSALVPLSGGYVNQYETGSRRPTVQVARRLDEILDAGGQLAALVHEVTGIESPVSAAVATVPAMTEASWGEMLRRTTHLVPPSLVIGDLGTARSGRLNPGTIDSVGDVAAHYRRAYHTVCSTRLLAAALAHLDLVMSLHPEAQPEPYRLSLLTTAGEMAALAGVLIGLDAGQSRRAVTYLDLAWAAARAAGNVELQAVTLGCRSFALSYGGGDHQAGLDCANLACELAADGRTSAETRGWVAAVASERCASIGDFSGCRECLDRSRDALDEVDRGEVVWRGIGGFGVEKLRAYEGGDMVRLGRYADAEPILTDAIACLDETMQRHRATALIDRAEARLGANDVDAACADALEALRLVTQVQHAGNFERIELIADRGTVAGAQSARELRREVQLTRADHGLPTRSETW
jgi:transcriptional regulator with XRE-family HTH domain